MRVHVPAGVSMNLPPAAKETVGTAFVRVIAADSLPKMDPFSHTDAYVRVKFAGKSICTTVVPDTEDPQWNQVLIFPVEKLAQLEEPVVLAVFDDDDNDKVCQRNVRSNQPRSTVSLASDRIVFHSNASHVAQLKY